MTREKIQMDIPQACEACPFGIAVNDALIHLGDYQTDLQDQSDALWESAQQAMAAVSDSGYETAFNADGSHFLDPILERIRTQDAAVAIIKGTLKPENTEDPTDTSDERPCARLVGIMSVIHSLEATRL